MSTIAPLRAADHADWLPLWRDYLRFYTADLADAVTEATFARLVAGDAMHGAIARDRDCRAVGIVHWLTHPSTWSTRPSCYLEDLFVSPDARGTGTGRALIAHVRAWAEQAGCSQVYWLTQTANATARTLYDQVATDEGFMHYAITLEG